jgi:NTE family protein
MALKDAEREVLAETFLGRLAPAGLAKVESLMVPRTFAKGDQIVSGREQAAGLHVIASGQAMEEVAASPGARTPPTHLYPGRIVGNVPGAPLPLAWAKVVASTECRTLHLKADDVGTLYRSLPRFKHLIDSHAAIRAQWGALLALASANRILRVLGREETERLLQSAELVRHAAGFRLLDGARTADSVFLILRGRIAVQPPRGPTRKRVSLSLLDRGHLIGEPAAVMKTPVHLDATVLERCTALAIDIGVFRQVIGRNPLVRRQILEMLATTGVAAAPRTPVENQLVFFVGVDSKVGARTVAYGTAEALRTPTPHDPAADVTLVDLRGDESAKRLDLLPEDATVGGVRARRFPVSEDWTLPVSWPADPDQATPLLETLVHSHADKPRVIVVTGARELLMEHGLLEHPGAVVAVRNADERGGYSDLRSNQYRINAIRNVKGQFQPLGTSRKAVRFPTDQEAANRFWHDGMLAGIATPGTPLGRACCRLGRVLRGSSVGLALGGGGALGFAHVGLIRALIDASIPIDFVSGVSFGSLVGALYAAGRLPVVERLVAARHRLNRLAVAAVRDSDSIRAFIDELAEGATLEMTEIAFYPVGLDLNDGREFVMDVGSVGMAARSASCMPGAWEAFEWEGHRLVDGGVVNNVPVSPLWEAGADFIIAANIIPPNPTIAPLPIDRMIGSIGGFDDGSLVARMLGGVARTIASLPVAQVPIERMNEVLTSLYNVMSQVGRDRSIMADHVFEPLTYEYDMYSFDKGDDIADAGERHAAGEMTELIDSYRTSVARRF